MRLKKQCQFFNQILVNLILLKTKCLYHFCLYNLTQSLFYDHIEKIRGRIAIYTLNVLCYEIFHKMTKFLK
jgi:hypothetical protein